MELKYAVIQDEHHHFAVVIVKENIIQGANCEALRSRLLRHYLKSVDHVLFMVDGKKLVFNGDPKLKKLMESKDNLEINDLPWKQLPL